MKAGKMKPRYGFSSTFLRSEIFLAVWIELSETSAQQNNGASRYPPMLSLPGEEVCSRDTIVGIFCALTCYVQHDGRSHQLFERYLINRVSASCEMDRRIEVRASVFGCGILVRRVVKAFVGDTLKVFLQVKRFSCRPIHGVRPERVREINYVALEKDSFASLTNSNGMDQHE